MRDDGEISGDLCAHQAMCQELLGIIARENQALGRPESVSAFEFYQARKSLLPRLDHSLAQLKQHRAAWQKGSGAERRQSSEVGVLIRSLQEQIMKIVLLDRENEQALLRRGLLPSNQLPSPHRQRPHFVAELYRRHRPTS